MFSLIHMTQFLPEKKPGFSKVKEYILTYMIHWLVEFYTSFLDIECILK